MPFIYIWSRTDFVNGLPNETGSDADGSGPWTITLRSGVSGSKVEVIDDDDNFDEVDSSQRLAHDHYANGEFYPAGTGVKSSYDLIDSSSGLKVTAIHFFEDGRDSGQVHGLISNQPLQQGQSYTFDIDRTSHRQDNPYDEYVPCFADGTCIDTPTGPVNVAALGPGARLTLAGGGTAPVMLRLSRTVSAARQAAVPGLRPIRIRAGALGGGLPLRDLRVSAQHRMLLRNAPAARMFGTDEVLVPAIKLTKLPGIAVEPPTAPVTYHHLVMERHCVIHAEGAPTESFYPGPMALAAMPHAARAELHALFPNLSQLLQPARHIPSPHRQKRLVARLARNARPAVERAGAGRAAAVAVAS
ncbi:MAG: Hint domain-containing protein [Paracoccaceae bacterium]